MNKTITINYHWDVDEDKLTATQTLSLQDYAEQKAFSKIQEGEISGDLRWEDGDYGSFLGHWWTEGLEGA
jgi:hypothetical protein